MQREKILVHIISIFYVYASIYFYVHWWYKNGISAMHMKNSCSKGMKAWSKYIRTSLNFAISVLTYSFKYGSQGNLIKTCNFRARISYPDAFRKFVHNSLLYTLKMGLLESGLPLNIMTTSI